MRLCCAITIHKSQGQRLSKAVSDLGKKEMAAGCTFVAVSRQGSLEDGVFIPTKTILDFLWQELSDQIVRSTSATRCWNNNAPSMFALPLCTILTISPVETSTYFTSYLCVKYVYVHYVILTSLLATSVAILLALIYNLHNNSTCVLLIYLSSIYI